jgi:hypothetical protein
MRLASMTLGCLAVLAACDQSSADRPDASGGGADASATAPDAATGPCSSLGETDCLGRSDCHAGFTVVQCRNALGYCAQFVSCQDGLADCLGPASCEILEPFCAGPFVTSYTQTCYGPCVRADQCAGCQDAKMTFTQADGCANDGSVEFCIPPVLQSAIQAIAPTTTCAAGTGRAGCDPATQLLCQFPTDATTCVTTYGALTDAAWDTLCGITMLPDVTEIVPTIAR